MIKNNGVVTNFNSYIIGIGIALLIKLLLTGGLKSLWL